MEARGGDRAGDSCFNFNIFFFLITDLKNAPPNLDSRLLYYFIREIIYIYKEKKKNSHLKNKYCIFRVLVYGTW